MPKRIGGHKSCFLYSLIKNGNGHAVTLTARRYLLEPKIPLRASGSEGNQFSGAVAPEKTGDFWTL